MVYTDGLGLPKGKKSFGEIFFKLLLRKKYCGFAVSLQIKSLTKIIDQNALEFLALWRDLLGIASEMLEILNKIFRIIFIQVSQLRELIEVKEVITSYGRSGS